MAFWQWEASMNIGVPTIDSQHRQIVDYINALSDALHDRHPEEVGKVLRELVRYTETHFAFEENLLSACNYPTLETHKQVHRNFERRINLYIEQHERGEDVGRKVLTDLKIWLTNHIQRDDKAYAPYVVKPDSFITKLAKRFFG